MNRYTVILAALLLLCPRSAVAAYVGVGDKAPAFEATTIEGQKVTFGQPPKRKAPVSGLLVDVVPFL